MRQIIWNQFYLQVSETVMVLACSLALGLFASYFLFSGKEKKLVMEGSYARVRVGVLFVLLKLLFIAPLILTVSFSDILNMRSAINIALAFVYGFTSAYLYQRRRAGFKNKKIALGFSIAAWMFLTYFFRNVILG